MKTYVEVMVSTEGEKASVISQKLLEMGLQPSIGEHDFVYEWKQSVQVKDVLDFVDRVQARLKGTGAILNFTTIR